MGSRLEKKSAAVRKQIESHAFTDEGGEEYAPSAFGGFPDYFRRKKIKLQNVDAEIRASASAAGPDSKPQIFKDVVAHVTGYTQPSLSDLHRMLVEHGAGFLQYLDGKTMATHIVCSALPPRKTVDYARYRMVKPAWVVDSIRAGKLLPWSEYRVIEEGPRQKTIQLDGGRMFSQATTQLKSPLGYREQTQNSFYTGQFQRSAGSSPLVTPRPKMRAVESIEDEMDDLDDDVDMVGVSKEAQIEHIEQPTTDSSTLTNNPSKVASPPSPQEGNTPPSHQAPPPPNEPPSKPQTSEEHNALLLSDPRLRKSSTANPEFLKQFYSESRLHHLSTWKAELKSKMQRLAADQAGGGPVPPYKPKRKPGARRYIMHVDFDSFFCAVSLKKHPGFAHKPAAVAHSTGGGSEIASCNYPARKFGVRNGMWMKRAVELCPDLKVVGYDFPAYEEASRLFYDAVLEVGGVVQSVSIDEVLVDVTSLVLGAAVSEGVGVSEGSIWREQEEADRIALRLRARVKEKTGCDVSVGIGGNILLAKVALRKGKPAGQYQIRPEEVLGVLADLKVEDLPGVAYSIGGKLAEIGVKLVSDIRQTSKERLTSVLGPKTGEKLWEYARGIDRTEVGEQTVRKSVSAEVNWGIRFVNQQEAEEFVGNLCKELERRVLNEGVKGKHLTVKIMRRASDAPLDPPKHLGHGKCDVYNKSVVFGVATNSGDLIAREAIAVLRSYKFSPGDLRGIGVQLTKLEPLKASSTTLPEGSSQKRLNFGTFTAPPSAKKPKIEAIEEDVPTPEKPSKSSRDTSDPIADGPLTPRKPKIHPALALWRANEADPGATTPLNVTGTQFIMPTNPDPAVLAELPPDIRSHFVVRSQSRRSRSREPSPPISRSRTPAIQNDPVDIPPDIDPEVFHALPEDVKAEVLAAYGVRGRTPLAQQQQQQLGESPAPSPRKDTDVIPPGPPKRTAAKRGRGRGSGIKNLFGRAATRERASDARVGLHQTSFVTSAKRGAAPGLPSNQDDLPEEIDPSFLAELPPDMQREVLADHRRRRMALKGGLRAPRPPPAPPRRRWGGGGQEGLPKLAFPARPAKAGLSASGFREWSEVRDMVSAWVRETKGEGPHGEDVGVLERYLVGVVGEERDMEKARRVVRWLEWVVEEDEEEEGEGEGRMAWMLAVERVKGRVQEAVQGRGLGSMEFG